VLRDLLAQPGRRAMLGRSAVAHARRYSWSRTASGLLAVYREAICDHHTRLAEELALLPAA
jgi:D-inositol-3-phosphate glycosyltransferase